MSVSMCAMLCRAQGPGKTGSGSCQTEGELGDLWQVAFKLKEDFFLLICMVLSHIHTCGILIKTSYQLIMCDLKLSWNSSDIFLRLLDMEVNSG